MAADTITWKKAVALKYKDRDRAPVVTAKGQAKIAEAIIEKANEHDIAIYEDPDLVVALSTLEIDQEIPEELYQAVAEVLAFLYKQNAIKGGW
ncbi:EscU/YscU/HrcU family type III secretion system export apparatus switch protein [Desulfurispira natronophila]|uniref:Flagellar biosynthesis protein n=1 Tax=Desulfurispira natronophila TaxID=682562 RepID=A0A7W7Y427_9BACT|nr:EscU/YscU/HrcU family type III secretion system export apparatus switch protein [Desulfurispira natronophila]MBB5021703.1 flagellar biosynthesis protein [Desulfurispira natronophila]